MLLFDCILSRSDMEKREVTSPSRRSYTDVMGVREGNVSQTNKAMAVVRSD